MLACILESIEKVGNHHSNLCNFSITKIVEEMDINCFMETFLIIDILSEKILIYYIKSYLLLKVNKDAKK